MRCCKRCRVASFLTSIANAHQNNTRQNTDDGDNHQKLYERESSVREFILFLIEIVFHSSSIEKSIAKRKFLLDQFPCDKHRGEALFKSLHYRRLS